VVWHFLLCLLHFYGGACRGSRGYVFALDPERKKWMSRGRENSSKPRQPSLTARSSWMQPGKDQRQKRRARIHLQSLEVRHHIPKTAWPLLQDGIDSRTQHRRREQQLDIDVNSFQVITAKTTAPAVQEAGIIGNTISALLPTRHSHKHKSHRLASPLRQRQRRAHRLCSKMACRSHQSQRKRMLRIFQYSIAPN
jgi:hypothetical protein